MSKDKGVGALVVALIAALAVLCIMNIWIFIEDAIDLRHCEAGGYRDVTWFLSERVCLGVDSEGYTVEPLDLVLERVSE